MTAQGIDPVPDGTRAKIFVAMSGGVDSSVAALLLQREGCEVVGITFKLFANETLGLAEDRPCCSLESVKRARAVCTHLGIPHYTLTFTEQFGAEVIDRFVSEYLAGRTPNPCVLCNRYLKFGVFWRQAQAMGAAAIATGHHARIRVIGAPESRAEGTAGQGSRYQLWPGCDRAKDQSYALAYLNQSLMPQVRLPVGELTKAQVRELAAAARLPTAEVEESQDICFIRQGSYREFLTTRTRQAEPGPIISAEGKTLGEHRGLENYTVGQRKNLHLSAGRRLYVIEKRLSDNTLVVGDYAQACREWVEVEEVNWCDLPAGGWPEAPQTLAVRAMLRYRQRLLPCHLEQHDSQARTVTVRLAEPGIAAPGQLLVLYDAHDNHVVMGGTIR